MRALVTGSCGYVASALIPEMLRTGYEVVGVDRRPSSRSGLTAFVQCDLLNVEQVAEAATGAQMLVHLAAAKDDWGLSAAEYERDNVAATRALLGVAQQAGIQDVVYYSTVGVLGPSAEPLDESAPPRPNTPYGRTKLEAERLMIDSAAADPETRLIVVRPSAIFGPGNPPNTNIARLITAIDGGRFLMVGDGRVAKTTSYIENVVAATLFLQANMPRGVHIYHYVDDPILETEQLVAEIHAILGKRRRRLRLPVGAAVTVAQVADWVGKLVGVDLPITSARIEKFATATAFGAQKIRKAGFHQPVSNSEALRRTVEWHLSN